MERKTMSEIEKVSAGLRQTTSDGGSTRIDANFSNNGDGLQLSGASVGLVRPTGQDSQWSVNAQVNAVNGQIVGGQVNVEIGQRPGTPTAYTTTQTYTLADGTTREIEMPGMRINRDDPGVDRTAVGVTVTGSPQQVTGDPLNVTATPQASLAVGANANGTVVVTGDARAQLDSTLGQRDVGVQAQYNSDQNRVTVTPYQTDRNGNAALDNTMDALYAPSRPQPTPAPAAPNAEQAAAALREDPRYGQAISALQQQGHPLEVKPDSPTDRLAVAVVIAAQQQNVDEIRGIAYGNTVVGANGQPDRNVFFHKDEPSGNLRVSEQAALSTPAGQQAVQAQQTPTQNNPNAPAITAPAVENPTQDTPRRSLQ
jgi:hypothetical protein